MNISEIRSRFPVLKKYTYLNTARFCALPSQVVETQEQFHKHLVEKGSWHFEDWLDMYEHTRKMVAEMLGTSPGSIFFLPNVSTGINMASLYLERKRIILLQGDFPSVVLPWKSLGFEIVELQYNSPDFYQALHEEIKKGNRNLCLSWIQSFDGFEVDLKQIFEWCKAYKTTLILDGTQGMGAIPVQIDPEVSMVFLATGFKWLLAGYGIAIGYVSDDLINRFKAFTGWNSIDYGTGDLKAGAASLEVGNALFHGVLGLYEGLKILK
ncbi:MAG: aminotransferase class V-fold PLP-dependent enzyme, partial [Cyclobacteriaceae bacterium]|nr:aminotransferase class V-fold PLP-dependent enzyme [Cyclobacteriaceae bacterium HetDA_MAG_MS6]